MDGKYDGGNIMSANKMFLGFLYGITAMIVIIKLTIENHWR